MTDQIATIAAIIQGEARSPADQFGVAASMQNRLDQGMMGSDGGAFGVATAPAQYSAYPNAMQTPTPYATNLATALVNGNLSDYGNTGNATYYNAWGYNQNYASGTGNDYGYKTNQYSDRFNDAPSNNFVLPQANGVTDASVAAYSPPYANDASAIDPTQAQAGAANGTFANTPLTGLGVGGGNPYSGTDASGLPNFGATGPNNNGPNPFSNTDASGTPTLGAPSQGNSSGTGQGVIAGTDSATGAPIYLTDPNAVASKAGASVQSGLETASKSWTQGVKDLIAEATGLTQYAGNFFSDTLPRIGFAVLALILIAFGLWFMGKERVAA
jgi:hypothetical protein